MSASEPRRVQSVDAHIGLRSRQARLAANLSQGVLAKQLGITFQQIQKYENGVNRISAGRLYQVANILDLPITFFYEEIANGAKVKSMPTRERANTRSTRSLARRRPSE
jgi:transcriptional regulator with XRE-family HTH domain